MLESHKNNRKQIAENSNHLQCVFWGNFKGIVSFGKGFQIQHVAQAHIYTGSLKEKMK